MLSGWDRIDDIVERLPEREGGFERDLARSGEHRRSAGRGVLRSSCPS